MRAAIVRDFGPVDSLQVEQVPDPVPQSHEVLVEVKATAANFVDLLVVGGKYQFLPPLPFVPGKLPTGVVTQVGADVNGLKVGDRVLTLAEQGGYAERVAVAASACFVLPDRLNFVDAAAMALAYDTAWFALRERGRAVKDETVLVLGASGGVGLAAVQLAKAYGMRVLAGLSSLEKADAMRAAGADEIIDLSVPNLRDGLREQVLRHTDGRGADVVLDPLGGDIFDAAIRAVAWRGRLVVIGFAAGRIPTMKLNYVLLKNIEVSGVQVSDYRKRTPKLMSDCIHEIFRLYEEGSLVPSPTVTFDLADVTVALKQLETRSARGRLIVVPQK